MIDKYVIRRYSLSLYDDIQRFEKELNEYDKKGYDFYKEYRLEANNGILIIFKQKSLKGEQFLQECQINPL